MRCTRLTIGVSGLALAASATASAAVCTPAAEASLERLIATGDAQTDLSMAALPPAIRAKLADVTDPANPPRPASNRNPDGSSVCPPEAGIRCAVLQGLPKSTFQHAYRVRDEFVLVIDTPGDLFDTIQAVGYRLVDGGAVFEGFGPGRPGVQPMARWRYAETACVIRQFLEF
jgi:hypothetical protein